MNAFAVVPFCSLPIADDPIVVALVALPVNCVGWIIEANDNCSVTTTFPATQFGSEGGRRFGGCGVIDNERGKARKFSHSCWHLRNEFAVIVQVMVEISDVGAGHGMAFLVTL